MTCDYTCHSVPGSHKFVIVQVINGGDWRCRRRVRDANEVNVAYMRHVLDRKVAAVALKVDQTNGR